MSRENARSKGRRYLAEGRLVIRSLDRRSIKAECRGDGAIYQLGWDLDSGWFCSCPALGRCSHLFALGLVVAVGRPF